MGRKVIYSFICIAMVSLAVLGFSRDSQALGGNNRGPHVEGGATGDDFILLFDTDKDGKISHKEWEAVKPATVYRNKHWPAYDKNRDGSITLDEAPLPEDPAESAPPSGDEHEVNINQIAFIVKFDKNGDGKLDNKEFTGSHFPQYDKNGDGFIEAHEAPAGETAY